MGWMLPEQVWDGPDVKSAACILESGRISHAVDVGPR